MSDQHRGDGTLASLIERERDRLTSTRDAALAKIREGEQEIEAIERGLAAVSTYFDIKEGRTPAQPVRKGRQPRTGRAGLEGQTGTRAPRGERRTQLLTLLQQKGPLTRRGIIDSLGLRGGKQGEQSISNLLTNLKKANAVEAVEGGKYRATG